MKWHDTNRSALENRNAPYLKSLDAVLSCIAKKRAFFAPKLIWDDRDSNGKVISQSIYGVRGRLYAPQGIVKAYCIDSIDTGSSAGLLYVYDYQSGNWFRNNSPFAQTEDHPCHPCVPPDKPVIPLRIAELQFLMQHGLMDLMEAKLSGAFDQSDRVVYLFEESFDKWLDWFTRAKP